jgi:hypothetical protein
MRNLQSLIGALVVAALVAGCAGSSTTQLSAEDQCKRSGGFWNGGRCDFSGGGGGGY